MAVPLGMLAILAITVSSESAEEKNRIEPLRIVWDLHVGPDTEHVIRWLDEQGWCWAVEVPPHAPPEQVLSLRDRGFRVVGQIHGHPDTRAWHWSRRGMDVPDLEKFIALLREANAEPPRVQFLMEDDSAGVGFSAEFLRNPPESYAQAKARFDVYLDAAMNAARSNPDVEPWAMAGFAGTAHHYARHGVRCVIVERANDDVEDLQSAIAFARGAARQFNIEWGIDLSLWWGVIYGCVQDLPASFYTRHLWLSHISGAQVFRIEGGDLLVRPEGPTTVARAIDAFAIKAKNFDPGVAEVPVAIMLPQDHGWMTPAYWRTTNEAWNYARLPYRQGYRGIDGFFAAAFPGAVYAQDPFPLGRYEDDDPPASPFALSCITAEFAPTPEQESSAEGPLPFGAFHNRAKAREHFLGNGVDPSPYRPMGDSRWGDIFDVFTDDAPSRSWEHYQALIVLGPVPITPGLREMMIAYASSGGTVIVAAGSVGPEDTELCGFEIMPEMRVGRAWQWRDEAPVHEAFRFCPATLPDEDGGLLDIMATTQGGVPLVLSHALGSGRVITCLLPWYETGHAPLAGLALRLLDATLEPLQPVVVEGPPAAWVSAQGRASEHRSLVIANHNDHPWEGSLRLRNMPAILDVCKDLISEEYIDFTWRGGETALALTIPPFEVRVLHWPSKESQP